MGQGKTAAANALAESRSQTLQFRDPLIQHCSPGLGKLRPITLFRHSVSRKLRQFAGYLLQAQPDTLRKNDECHAAKHRPGIAPMSGGGSLSGDQAAGLIETKRRSSDTAAGSDFADGEQCLHAAKIAKLPLDLKCTLTFRVRA